VEDSARGQNSVNAGVPLFILVVLTLLMLQLRSFSRSVLVLLTAPLGLIGVVLFLLVFRVPFGFVAMLGTIALAGMIMRNSVILVDQIEQDIAAGHARWQAIIDATVRRFRPIVLTALAAVLAMIPAVAQRLLRADGGGDHGRSDRGDRADAAVPAGAVCGLVPGAEG
jgi:multidrug efflux pump